MIIYTFAMVFYKYTLSIRTNKDILHILMLTVTA